MVVICERYVYGYDAGLPPKKHKYKHATIKIQKQKWVSGRKYELRKCGLTMYGSTKSEKIANKSATTPNNLSGTARKIA